MLDTQTKTYAHKNGFIVKATVNFTDQTIELSAHSVPYYFFGPLSTYENFNGNMQEFINAHHF